MIKISRNSLKDGLMVDNLRVHLLNLEKLRANMSDMIKPVMYIDPEISVIRKILNGEQIYSHEN